MNPTMTRPVPRTRGHVIAGLLTAAAVLWVVAYLQHPPGEGVSLARTMQVVVEHTAAWRWSHLGIAAGYLVAGIGAVLAFGSGMATTRRDRIGWAAMAVAAVPLVAYLIVESTVASTAALAGDLGGFDFWYGTVAVWSWRLAWPVFFGGMTLVAVDALRSGSMPRWSTMLAVGGAGFGVLAPVFSAAGLSAASFAAFITPVLAWIWLAAFGVRAVRPSRTTVA